MGAIPKKKRKYKEELAFKESENQESRQRISCPRHCFFADALTGVIRKEGKVNHDYSEKCKTSENIWSRISSFGYLRRHFLIVDLLFAIKFKHLSGL
jgi:hypothetical protein